MSVELSECVYMFEFVWDAASSLGLSVPLAAPGAASKASERRASRERRAAGEGEKRDSVCEGE